MGNPVVHFEITGPTPDKVASFYSELFGWHTESMQMPQGKYIVIDTHATGGINGGFGQTDDGSTSVVFYAEVPDVQKALDKAEKLGGKTIHPLTEIPNIVTFAIFADPQGNNLGLVQAGDGTEGAPPQGDNAPVSWFEILGADPKALWTFYEKLFGWKIEKHETPEFAYGEVDTKGKGRGINGGIGSSPDGMSHVTVYTAVNDLAKYLQRAESLGAKTIMPPTTVMGETTIAMFADPQGTAFGMFKR